MRNPVVMLIVGYFLGVFAMGIVTFALNQQNIHTACEWSFETSGEYGVIDTCDEVFVVRDIAEDDVFVLGEHIERCHDQSDDDSLACF